MEIHAEPWVTFRDTCFLAFFLKSALNRMCLLKLSVFYCETEALISHKWIIAIIISKDQVLHFIVSLIIFFNSMKMSVCVKLLSVK